MKNYVIDLSAAILELPRFAKQLVALSVDFCFCILTVWLAFYLRLGEFVPFSTGVFWACAWSVCVAIPIFIVNGLYRAIYRYSGGPALLAVANAVGIYGLFYSTFIMVIGVVGVPRTVGIIQPILLLLFIGTSRAFARAWLGGKYVRILKRTSLPRVLIYGAGETGRQLARAMINSHETQIVGFLDDDEGLQGSFLNGLPVFKSDDVKGVVKKFKISNVWLAMPNISRQRRHEILKRIQTSHVVVRSLPSMSDLTQGRVSIADLRELDLDDLLGRDQVVPDPTLLALNIRGKVVMVTGAGGSIGSELCRQIVAVGPSKLLLIEQSEFALYAIHQELEGNASGKDIELLPLLVSVRDYERMREITSTWRPDTVYHAAAYKHVPMVEHNLAEGIKNNVLGTLFTARAALQSNVSNFVLISSDKAVRPTNMMGASKRLAEMVLQALAVRGTTSTKFSMVRFGNVLGSSGSVVPKFRQQIRDGGPITLTHPEITRYFMTIPEASQLVIQASAMAEGGDVFVLDMGQSVKIMDLAKRMIELSGLLVKDEQAPDGDIAIEITGLRPGEKLYEELLIGDNPRRTRHDSILKAQEEFLPWSELEIKLALLEVALSENDIRAICLMMEKLVTGFRPSEGIVDLVYLEQLALGTQHNLNAMTEKE